jgi:hypothetical protein
VVKIYRILLDTLRKLYTADISVGAVLNIRVPQFLLVLVSATVPADIHQVSCLCDLRHVANAPRICTSYPSPISFAEIVLLPTLPYLSTTPSLLLRLDHY